MYTPYGLAALLGYTTHSRTYSVFEPSLTALGDILIRGIEAVAVPIPGLDARGQGSQVL